MKFNLAWSVDNITNIIPQRYLSSKIW